ncbi:hypothetical protein HFP72_03640 [Nocardiopsis sp. ARC36]
MNKDLAEVFGRHNDEFLTPYNPASPTGASAFDNATKAAAARNDFADLFARNFGDHLGEAAARDLGRDYATTLARHWNDPDLGRHLRDTLGDRLPPHMRDHLADVPVNLQKPLGEYFSTTSAYTQQVGGSIGTGALEGYLGEGLGSLADGRGWEASGYSATAGATQAGIQQGATDGILHGTELFKDKDKPDLDTSATPSRTQSEGTDNRNDHPTGPRPPTRGRAGTKTPVGAATTPPAPTATTPPTATAAARGPRSRTVTAKAPSWPRRSTTRPCTTATTSPTSTTSPTWSATPTATATPSSVTPIPTSATPTTATRPTTTPSASTRTTTSAPPTPTPSRPPRTPRTPTGPPRPNTPAWATTSSTPA